MKYETMPVKPLIKRKFAAKLTNDITKLSTWRILVILYRRHELGLWQSFTALIFVIGILRAFDR